MAFSKHHFLLTAASPLKHPLLEPKSRLPISYRDTCLFKNVCFHCVRHSCQLRSCMSILVPAARLGKCQPSKILTPWKPQLAQNPSGLLIW
ncbi:hypothetical protein GDO78_017669 [Eleutherodactylus coqui]|uniref:Uncharacterized protein n=1 Tax=Eleutherodactylus coqui TaxID=57060 RepID=A0A8J6JV59_ELECQ|nr:hypothetical protein GDO78_017669 [Eleutherodactylus coqui]